MKENMKKNKRGYPKLELVGLAEAAEILCVSNWQPPGAPHTREVAGWIPAAPITKPCSRASCLLGWV